MATPAYHIYYGQYPDQATNEIPNDQIKSVDGLRFSIEPGKPAEPKVDEVSFTIENLNADGTERYDEAWFDAHSRSQAEGATFPNQLFFSVEADTGAKFIGVVKSKSYGQWRETVTVDLKSLLELAGNNNLQMLKAFPLEDCEANIRYDCDASSNNFPCAVDLNGNDITQEQMLFIIEQHMSDTGWVDLEHSEILQHFWGIGRLPNPDAQPSDGNTLPEGESTGYINAYVKIGDNTILTTIKLSAQKAIFEGQYQSTMIIYVYQAKNGNVQLPDRTILERGRFFADDKGTDFEEFQKYTITLLEPDRGYDADIILSADAMPDVQYMFGCPVVENANGKLELQESATGTDVFDLPAVTLNALQERLFARYYYNGPDNLDLANLTATAVRAFWADVAMFGWTEQSTGDVLVNMATLTGCYVYCNEQGKIVFQDRLLHENYLPAALPPGAFEVDLADIRPLGSQEDGNGFDSYSIEYNDRVEINNVSSDSSKKQAVDADGVRSKPALRNTDLQVEAYRTQNLGVPTTDNGLPLFRRRPDDAGFGVSALDLTDFILTAPAQAQNFAVSWTYPVSLWKIEWDMPRYPQASIGGYFWVQWPGANRVYFIRDITHDGDHLTHKMEVQKVGVWNG